MAAALEPWSAPDAETATGLNVAATSASRPRSSSVPGRGTYNAGELGYLDRFHGADAAFLRRGRRLSRRPGPADLCARSTVPTATRPRSAPPRRQRLGVDLRLLPTLTSSPSTATRSTWSPSPATPWAGTRPWPAPGRLHPQPALALVNTMGRYMHEASIGGQAIWTLVDEDWRTIPGQRQALLEAIAPDRRSRRPGTEHLHRAWAACWCWLEMPLGWPP